MNLLGQVKQKYSANPNAMLRKVNEFPQRSDTVKVGNWDFDPNKIHLIGIRRDETKAEAKPGERKFDDVFILLILFVLGHASNPRATIPIAEGIRLARRKVSPR